MSGSGQSATNSQKKKRKSDHGDQASNRSKRSNASRPSTEAKENLILLNGVQGSLNLVVDTLRSVESNIDSAVKIAQTEIHGLDEVDKILIGSFFSQFPNKAAAFCGYSPGINRDTFIMVELEQFKAEHPNLVTLVERKLSQRQELV